MPDAHQLLVFIAAGWLLNLTPGPDVLYIVTHALRSGVRAGVAAALGITAGCFVHVFAAAIGVGALLATSAVAFTLLKWAGAGYLLWMGVRLLFAKAPGQAQDLQALAAAQPRLGFASIVRGGFLTNVLNPKVAIFFLAFVPQFIDPAAGNTALVFVALGILFNVSSLPINIGWAAAAGWMAGRGSVQRAMHWLDRAAGAMFIGFGAKLALTDNPSR